MFAFYLCLANGLPLTFGILVPIALENKNKAFLQREARYAEFPNVYTTNCQKSVVVTQFQNNCHKPKDLNHKTND